MIRAFAKTTGIAVKFEESDSRPSDEDEPEMTTVEDVRKAKEELGFEPKYDIEFSCQKAWDCVVKRYALKRRIDYFRYPI